MVRLHVCSVVVVGLLAAGACPWPASAQGEASPGWILAPGDSSRAFGLGGSWGGGSRWRLKGQGRRSLAGVDSLYSGLVARPTVVPRLVDVVTTGEPVANPNLCGANGNVLGIARSGNTLYIAGSFRSVGKTSGGFVPLDTQTGEARRPFPKVAGSVYAIVPDGSGGWYIGGEFTAVEGRARFCLAQIRADGSVSNWNPIVTGSPGYIDPPSVSAIAVSGDRVFIGGGFREIGGQPRMNLGCVDAGTGAVLEWNPGTHVDGWVSTLAASDSTVFVGGYFFSIGGQSRSCLAAVDALTGEVQPWQADAGGAVWCLLVRGTTLFVGGEFGRIAAGSRPLLAAIDIPTAQLLPFDASARGIYLPNFPLPRIGAMTLVGDTLYVGGDFVQIGGQPRASLAALSVATAEALPWAPPSFGPLYDGYPQACYALAVKDSTIYVGGTFDFVGSTSRPCAAALNRRTAELTEWNPRPDLPIYALATSDNVVCAGGEFSFLGDWTHRAGLAAIDLATGDVKKPWNPNPNGGVVTAVAARGDRVFVSGDFTTIGGDPQPRNYFAALDTLHGEVTDWNPGADNVATTLLLEGDTLFAGGYFTQVGGQPRNYLAAISTTSGEVLPWDPNADLPVLTMASGEDAIYVVGLFDQIGGQPRGGIAAVNPISGTLTPWNPGTDNNTVDAVLASADRIYVGGGFGMIGGQPRSTIAALDAATGEALSWDPQTSGWGTPPRVRAFALVDGKLYAGGSFGTIGGQSRICLAAVDTATGLATSWDPGLNGLVWSLLADGRTIYAGGGFTRAGGLPCAGLAAFSIPDSTAPVPVRFTLAQCIPNPVHSSAMIRYGLPTAVSVSLSIYDVQGRRLATPVNHELQSAGYHDVPVHAETWRPGVYLYRLGAGGTSVTRKLVVVK